MKYSEKDKIFNLHIPWSKFPEIQERIELRKKIIVQMKSYQDRVRYLERIEWVQNKNLEHQHAE